MPRKPSAPAHTPHRCKITPHDGYYTVEAYCHMCSRTKSYVGSKVNERTMERQNLLWHTFCDGKEIKQVAPKWSPELLKLVAAVIDSHEDQNTL